MQVWVTEFISKLYSCLTDLIQLKVHTIENSDKDRLRSHFTFDWTIHNHYPNEKIKIKNK